MSQPTENIPRTVRRMASYLRPALEGATGRRGGLASHGWRGASGAAAPQGPGGRCRHRRRPEPAAAAAHCHRRAGDRGSGWRCGGQLPLHERRRAGRQRPAASADGPGAATAARLLSRAPHGRHGDPLHRRLGRDRRGLRERLRQRTRRRHFGSRHRHRRGDHRLAVRSARRRARAAVHAAAAAPPGASRARGAERPIRDRRAGRPGHRAHRRNARYPRRSIARPGRSIGCGACCWRCAMPACIRALSSAGPG